MATTRPEKPEKRLRKKKKPPKKFRLSYSLLLLLAMVVVGSIAGLVAYRFGKQALEGVNPSPAGIKLPKVSPVPKPKDSPKSSPSSQDGKTSFLLDENEVIADMKSRSQQELGGLTRPAFVAKADISDRKKIYTRVDRAYNSIREPLAISANADERIAERIAALRKTVYSRTRAYESDLALNQPIANNVSASMPLLSTPIEIDSIRNRWEDRYTPSGSSSKNDIQISPKSTSSFFIPEQQPYSAEVNRR